MLTKAISDRIDTVLQRDFVDPSTWHGAAFYAAVFLILAATLAGVLAHAVRRPLITDQRRLLDRTAVSILTEPGQFGVYLLMLLAYLHLIPSLRGIGVAMLISVSVISLMVGFAAQNALSNGIGGIALVLHRPFQLGDWIQVNGPQGFEIGIVESVTPGYTAIQTSDGRRVIVPNSQMASQP
jgi:small-conductance mechanosensitive channel